MKITAAGDIDVLEPQKIKSLMAAPLMEGAECVGFVGFDYVEKYHAIYTSSTDQ